MKTALLFLTFVLFFRFPAFSISLTPQEEAKEYSRMVEACQEGDVDTVRACLNLGVDPNRKDRDSLTPLCHAAAYGSLEVTQLLLDRGASPKYLFDWDRCSPLSYAIEGGNLEVVRCLLETGILRGKDSEKYIRSGILATILANNADMLDLLVQYDVDPLHMPGGEYNALTLASNRDAEKIVAYLLKAGVSPNVRDPKGRIALACTSHYATKIVRLLLEAGADPNLNSGRRFYKEGLPYLEYNPLLNAILAHNVEAVNLLLKAGADPTEPDDLPLMISDMRGNVLIRDMLLAAGAPTLPPYAFLDLNPDITFRLVDIVSSKERAQVLPFVPEPFEETVTRELPPPLPVTLGILVRDRSLRDLETLLSAGLSELPKLTMVDRNTFEALSRELSLNDGLKNNPAYLLRTGEFLGADMLVMLEREGPEIHLSLVNSETGLVLTENRYLADEDPDMICQDFLTRVTANRGKHNLQPDQLVLISIPSLTSEQTDLFSHRMTSWAKRGLEQELTRRPQVYLLERDLLGNLAKEKSLNDSQREFFNSGWILDGSVSVTTTDHPEILLRLRAQGPGETPTIELTRSVALDDLTRLLSGIVDELLAEIGSTPDQMLSRGALEEMDAYQRKAEQAVDLNEWGIAHRNIAVAWALGDRRRDTKDLLVRSAVHAIRESDLSMIREINSLPTSLRKLAAYRYPLLIRNEHPTVLDRYELLEMVHNILDLYDTVLRTPGPMSNYDFALLGFLPVAMRAVVKPLEYSPSLSDEEQFGQELSGLRSRILEILDLTLEVTEDQDMPTLYDSTLAVKLEHLPLLLLSPVDFHREVKQIFLEATTLIQEPHNPHLIYQTAYLQAIRAADIRTTWANVQWYRMVEWMDESEDPQVKVIELEIRKHLTNNPGKQLKIRQELLNAVQTAIWNSPTFGTRTLRHPDLKIPQEFWVNWYRKWSTHHQYVEIWHPDLFKSPHTIAWDKNRLGSVYGQRSSYRLRQIQNQTADFMGDYLEERGGRALRIPGFFLVHIESPVVLNRLLGKLERASSQMPSPPEVTASHAESISKWMDYLIHKTRDRLNELAFENTPWFTLNLKNFQTVPIDRDSASLRRSLNGFVLKAKDQLILFDPQGTITHRIPFPKGYEPAEDSFIHTTYEESMDSTRFAVLLCRPRLKTGQIIGVYYFNTKQWAFFSVPELPESSQAREDNGLNTLILLKEHVVYSTIQNTIENPDIHTRLTINDPLRSINLSAIHLADSTHIPLAHNRWVPARSPVDSINDYFYRPFRLGDDQIGLEGWVYSFDEQSWVEGDTPPPDNRLGVTRNPLDYYMEIGGRRFRTLGDSTSAFSVRASWKSPATNQWNNRNGTAYFKFPDWAPLHVNDPRVEGKDDNGVYQPKFTLRSLEYGVLFHNRQGFCFIPKSEIQELLQPVIAKMGGDLPEAE